MKNVLKQLGKMICYVGLYLGMQFVVMFAMMFGYIVMAGANAGMQGIADPNEFAEKVSNDATQFIFANVDWMVIIATMISLLILWIFYAIRKKKLFQEIQLRKFSVKALVPSLMVALGAWLTVSFGMALLPIPESVWESYNQQAFLLVSDSTILMVLSTVIAAPIIEEIVFRGLSLSRLRRAMPTWVAVLVVSVVFGLMHGHPLWITYTACMGILFGAVALFTDSIGASILVHMVFNFFGSIVSIALPEEIAPWIMALCTVAGVVLIALGIWWLKKLSSKNGLGNVAEQNADNKISAGCA